MKTHAPAEVFSGESAELLRTPDTPDFLAGMAVAGMAQQGKMGTLNGVPARLSRNSSEVLTPDGFIPVRGRLAQSQQKRYGRPILHIVLTDAKPESPAIRTTCPDALRLVPSNPANDNAVYELVGRPFGEGTRRVNDPNDLRFAGRILRGILERTSNLPE